MSRTLMVQGTASSVGKSLLVTALCRLFVQEGYRVAPFKSQNMSLNAAVTPDGYEIGRAQAVQAEACGIAPSPLMNPILLKPEGESRSQVVVMGEVLRSMSASEYHQQKTELHGVIERCLTTLRAEYDLVIIEGAGSPAEVNLKDRDLVNMHVAKLADAPVLLVGDIDRGGVFAALVGTLELLDPDERDRVAGLIINKFRGDPALLGSGLQFLEDRTQKPVLGVVPHVPNLRIADEDSVGLESRPVHPALAAVDVAIDVAVVRLPRISNYDDVLPLERDPRFSVRFVANAADVGEPDLLIVPGSKSTLADLAWLRAAGLDDIVRRRAASGGLVLGICGGYQMLGQRIDDPERIESDAPSARGLGLLPVRTTFKRAKTTADIRFQPAAPTWLTRGVTADRLRGYEIHLGQVRPAGDAAQHSPFRILARNGAAMASHNATVDGSAVGPVAGTLIHGLFDNPELVDALARRLGEKQEPAVHERPAPDSELDRLTRAVRKALDLPRLFDLVGSR